MFHAKLKSLSLAVMVAATLGTSGVALAQSGNAEADSLLSTLRQTYQGTQFTSVSPTPIKGIWEVVMGQKVSYTDSSGRYFMFGNLVDLQTQENLTEGRVADLTKVEPNKLPVSQAIKTVKGDRSRKLWVFADPECGYCKQLENTLTKVENVTIYTFLMPVLGQKSYQNAESIWCAKDSSKAWQNYMLGTMPVATKKCENPLDANMKLGQSLGVTGTPTLIMENGIKVPGAVPLERLNQMLTSAATGGAVAKGK